MINAVLDSKVLASRFVGLARSASTPGELLRRWYAGVYTLIVSEHIVIKVKRTLKDRYFTRRLSPDQIAKALSSLRISAVVQPPTVRVHGVATQPKDDLVLVTAVSARTDYLVTGDHPRQAIGRYEAVAIVSPRRFLDLLDAEQDRL